MNAVNGGNFEFDYMENANLQNRITYPNGVIKTTSFEEKRNLITGINYQNDANVISNYAYENDVLGRRTNIGITYDNATRSNDYNYNPRSEVIGANGDTLNQAFDYDNIGNRITSENNGTTTNYTANNLNQYENVGDFVPLFDDDGNQTKTKTSMGEWLVTYNGENRPIKFTQGTKSIEMKYDYMGRRVEYISKLNNVVQSHKKFMYDGYTLIQTLNESNQLTQEFIWDPTAGTATKPLILRENNSTLYYLHDANKNVIGLTNDSSMSIAHYEYDTFGNLTTPTLNIDNPFRFSSEYHDDELGLVYYNYRHYNPEIGRWISRDPIEEQGGNNLYAMCENDIVNLFDYLGLAPSGVACPNGAKKDNKPHTLILQDKCWYSIYKYRTTTQNTRAITANGCSTPPGSGLVLGYTTYYNNKFENACNEHDKCYSRCGASKGSCDNKFLLDMRTICRNEGGRYGCYEASNIYYGAVDSFGGSNFDSAQDDFCLWGDCYECSK